MFALFSIQATAISHSKCASIQRCEAREDARIRAYDEAKVETMMVSQ